MLTTEFAIRVGLRGTPAVHGWLEEDPCTYVCPTSQLEYISQVRGYAVSPLHFLADYPDLPEHPANAWTLDDCVPDEHDVESGKSCSVIFLGFFNPQATLPAPTRPFFDCCIESMNQVATWSYTTYQFTLPIGMTHGTDDATRSSFNHMAIPNGWLDMYPWPRRIHVSLTGAGPDSEDLVQKLIHDLQETNVNYLTDLDTETPTHQKTQKIFTVPHLAEPQYTASFSATAPQWNPEFIAGILGRLTQVSMACDLDVQTLDVEIDLADADDNTYEEPITLRNRFVDFPEENKNRGAV